MPGTRSKTRLLEQGSEESVATQDDVGKHQSISSPSNRKRRQRAATPAPARNWFIPRLPILDPLSPFSDHHPYSTENRPGQGTPLRNSTVDGSKSTYNTNSGGRLRGSIPTLQKLRQENALLKEQSQDNLDAFKTEQLQHEETKALLEARTAELQSLQAFFGPFSKIVTEAEVKTMVEALNNEIIHVSAIIGNALTPSDRGTASAFRYHEAAAERLRASDLLDDNVLEKLWSANQDMSFRVQIALQGCMTYTSARIVNGLSHPGKGTIKGIGPLAQQVSQSVPFPLYAKWRAITHQQLAQPVEGTKFWLKQLTARTKDVIYVTGFTRAPPSLKLQDRLIRVIELAMALNVVVKQRMLYTDAHILYFGPGKEFNPATMHDDFIPPGRRGDDLLQLSQRREQIFCTTGIGLQFRDGNTGQSTVVLKTKVGLRGIFEDDSDSV
ncbi:hypothetical protein BDN72DRAFT_957281 [Pluteus cervinus]|uniref:Uncharacterized protein n=1 Tax=Pluteus cervinus TaxID=181527 RepID=A0ACD3B2Z5_9AGAR|nr:hypothetical protein BDN72DRAFT_957281 [Pluteus cervinus]